MVDKIKRMNYYNGLFLKEEDFTTDQDYNIKMRRLMNWSLNKVFGVLEGLKVEPSEGKKYKVSPGIALSKGEDDWHGVEMVLPSDEELDFSEKDPGDYYVTIKYNEDKEDKDESKGDSEIHLIERPIIEIKSSTATVDKEKEIILAKITVPNEAGWKCDRQRLNKDERREIGPALRCINDKAVVGTPNQPARLEVNGNIKANNGKLESLSVKGNVDVGAINPVGTVNIGSQMFKIEKSDGTPNMGYVRFGDGTGWKLHFGRSISGGKAVTGADGVMMTITDKGKVGIGTTDPKELLQIGDHIAFYNGGWKSISFNGYRDGSWKRLQDGYLGVLSWDTEKGAFRIYTGPSGNKDEKSESSENITILNNGNVGIGNVKPSEKLEVKGKITATEFIGDGFKITNIDGKKIKAKTISATDVGALPIDGGTIKGSLQVNGNVDIGKKGAKANLTVSGSLKVEGYIRVSNEIIQEEWKKPDELGHGWSESEKTDDNPPGYFRDKNGIVHLRGVVTKGNANEVIFVLPDGYKPKYSETFIVAANKDISVCGSPDYEFGICFVKANGDVCHRQGDTKYGFYLDGITFRAAKDDS